MLKDPSSATARLIRDRGWGVLALLGSVALAVEGLMPLWFETSVDPMKTRMLYAVACSAAAAVVGGVLELAKTPRISALESENRRMKVLLQDLATDHRTQVETILGTFFIQAFPGDHTCRVSAYRHDGAGRFVLSGRYSLSQVFRRSHRAQFSESEGILGEVWSKGQIAVMGLPDPASKPKEYDSFQFKRWGIPKPVVRALTMKPRSYVAVPMCAGNPVRYIGVIVMESTEPEGVNLTHADLLEQSGVMIELVDYLQASSRIEPYLGFAAERKL